ncbi:hypothetical protein DL96DRAFT_1558106 [Flagelloscypha sp. PMI_526]|nr:hypothetical protein DL96DRAFT_1558106 [Flagelloscypha sp. PMI_526]
MSRFSYPPDDSTPELLRLLGPIFDGSLSTQPQEDIPLAEAKEMKDAANRLFRQGDIESKMTACCIYIRIAIAKLIPADNRLTRIAYCNAAQTFFDIGITIPALAIFQCVVKLEPTNPAYHDRLLSAKAFVRAAKAICAFNLYDEALFMLSGIARCNIGPPQVEDVCARILDMKARWEKPVPEPGESLWSYRAVLTSNRFYDIQISLPDDFENMKKLEAIKLLKGIYEMTEEWFKEIGDFVCRACGAASTSGMFRHAEVVFGPPAKLVLVTVIPCCSQSCRVKAQEIDVGWGTAL